MSEAYLDIETTGLSPFFSHITVIGIYHDDKDRLVQLVHPDITRDNLLLALRGVKTIYTYNGSRFDLPFINKALGIDLAADRKHRDLMFDCWGRNLYGGLKRVEVMLGICRELVGVDGFEAVRLWWRYWSDHDEDSLATLLKYNGEDVLNLKRLKEKLCSEHTA